MLPSMPVLFSRESQDALGKPSTSKCYKDNIFTNVVQTQIQKPLIEKVEPNEYKGKGTKRKESSKDDVVSSEIDENAYENALVLSYFNKVQARFGTNISLPNNKFHQFQQLLKNFDPLNEKPTDLYRKMENLLGEENKDLIEEFLIFLTPAQAADVGRFMDHFMLTKMTRFLKLLQNTFVRKPTMLRKIVRAITNSVNCDTIDEMRSKVLPHLRSSPRLTEMFKSLFPDNVLPDSLYDSNVDMLNESFLTDDKGYDVWEFEEPAENRKNLCAKEGIDTMYLQGRVFLQHGKILKASNVTFPYSKEPYRVHVRRLAPSHCRLSPPQSDEEKTSPRRSASTSSKTTKSIAKRSKKTQPKSPCARNLLKDVNDNNKHNTKDHTTELNSKVTTLTESPKSMKSGRAHNLTIVTNTSDRCKAQETKTTEALDKKDLKTSKHSKDKIDPTKPTYGLAHKRDTKHKYKVDNKQSNHENKKDEGTKAKHAKIDATKVKSTETRPIQARMVNNSWTRDEDKTILQILQGEASSEQIFCRIRELLPHRTMTEIRERFSHVMNLLQQMALGEVT